MYGEKCIHTHTHTHLEKNKNNNEASHNQKITVFLFTYSFYILMELMITFVSYFNNFHLFCNVFVLNLCVCVPTARAAATAAAVFIP